MVARPRARRWVLAGVVGLLVVGGATVGLVATRGGTASSTTTRGPSAPTVTVLRGNLEQTQQVTGELGYGDPVTVTGQGNGIITWLPSAGVRMTRGKQLYRVNDAPVVVFFGGLPLYRTLADKPGKDGSPPTGHDVDLVAANLAALGFYDGSTTDTCYDGALAGAVKAWQGSLGREVTGVLAPADVVVTDGSVRVDGVAAHLGSPAAEDVLTVTSTTKVITLQAPVALAQSLATGRRVSVALPDGTQVRTRVSQIGTKAADGGDSGGPPSVPVVVTAQRRGALAHATLGSVTARLVTASRHDVLRVPVTALLALSGGGYAVERPDHTLVPVTLGMVADGAVEVSGIEAGAKVVVAR